MKWFAIIAILVMDVLVFVLWNEANPFKEHGWQLWGTQTGIAFLVTLMFVWLYWPILNSRTNER